MGRWRQGHGGDGSQPRRCLAGDPTRLGPNPTARTHHSCPNGSTVQVLGGRKFSDLQLLRQWRWWPALTGGALHCAVRCCAPRCAALRAVAQQGTRNLPSASPPGVSVPPTLALRRRQQRQYPGTQAQKSRCKGLQRCRARLNNRRCCFAPAIIEFQRRQTFVLLVLIDRSSGVYIRRPAYVTAIGPPQYSLPIGTANVWRGAAREKNLVSPINTHTINFHSPTSTRPMRPCAHSSPVSTLPLSLTKGLLTAVI